MPNSDIQDELGVQRRTLYLWFGDPLVREEINQQLARISEVFAEKLVAGALQALDALRDLVERPLDREALAPEERLEAIRELLDRCQFTAKIEPRPSAAALSCPRSDCPMHY